MLAQFINVVDFEAIELKILDPKIGKSIPMLQIATEGSAGMDMRLY